MPIRSIPDEFRHLVHCFHQDILLFASTEEGIVMHALRFLDPRQKEVVRKYLTDLLAENPDIGELQMIWDSAGPDWFVEGEGLRALLEMIRDRIE